MRAQTLPLPALAHAAKASTVVRGKKAPSCCEKPAPGAEKLGSRKETTDAAERAARRLVAQRVEERAMQAPLPRLAVLAEPGRLLHARVPAARHVALDARPEEAARRAREQHVAEVQPQGRAVERVAHVAQQHGAAAVARRESRGVHAEPAVAAVEGRDVAEVRSLRAGAHVDDDGRVAARELQDVLQRAQRVAVALVDEGADEDLRAAVAEQHREQAAAQPERPRASRAHHGDSCARLCSLIAAPASHAYALQ